MLHGQWHHCKVKKNTSVLKTIFDQAPHLPSLRKMYSERVFYASEYLNKSSLTAEFLLKDTIEVHLCFVLKYYRMSDQ